MQKNPKIESWRLDEFSYNFHQNVITCPSIGAFSGIFYISNPVTKVIAQQLSDVTTNIGCLYFLEIYHIYQTKVITVQIKIYIYKKYKTLSTCIYSFLL